MNEDLQLEPEAKYGIVGKVLDLYSQTEPCEASILFPFLTVAGNIIGDKVFIYEAGVNHSGRLFTVIVGKSSKGRKGTAWSYVKELIYEIIPEYAQNNIATGLSTGEGLIEAVKDDLIIKKKNKKTNIEEEEVVRGVDDKRLLFFQGEFSRVLRVMQRDTNTLADVVREAWDYGNMSVKTKNNPLKATGAHVSIIGNITQRELGHRLTQVDRENGFANRFLWISSYRKLIVPRGVKLDLNSKERLKFDLIDVLKKGDHQYFFSTEAALLYDEIYYKLARETPGMAGDILARGEALILRISVIYAWLDKSEKIEIHHLRAALACYNYFEKSVFQIFGDSFGDWRVDKLWKAIKSRKEINMTEVYLLFNNKITEEELNEIFEVLIGYDLIEFETQKTGIGRPIEIVKIKITK